MADDPDAAVDAAVMEVAQTWGVRTDRVEPVMDQYGVELVLQAKAQVESEMRNGFAVQSPFGYMISLLRKGVIQAQAVADQAAPDEDWLYDRYHRVRWVKQMGGGTAGLGSCGCCSGGGPYAGKSPLEKVKASV